MSATFYRFLMGISCWKTNLKLTYFAFFANFWWFFQHNLHQIVWTAMDRKYVSDHAKIQLFYLCLIAKQWCWNKIPYGITLWKPLCPHVLAIYYTKTSLSLHIPNPGIFLGEMHGHMSHEEEQINYFAAARLFWPEACLRDFFGLKKAEGLLKAKKIRQTARRPK